MDKLERYRVSKDDEELFMKGWLPLSQTFGKCFLCGADLDDASCYMRRGQPIVYCSTTCLERGLQQQAAAKAALGEA